MQKSVTGVLLAISSIAFSGQVQEKAASEIQPGYELKCNQLPAAYNAQARINPACNWDCFLTASFIYWQPQQGTFEVASYDNEAGKTQDVSMSLDFHPGFKVALGLSSGFDGWDTFIEYVRLHTRDVDHFQTPSWAVDISDVLGDMTVSSMTTVFKLRYDMLQWSLGRYFYNGKNLSLRPNFGIKGGWIDQYLHSSGIEYSTPTFSNFHNSKLDSWLIGPRLGINSKWLIGSGFRFFGDVDFSLLYQSLKGRYSYTVSNGSSVTTTAPHRITPNLGGILGLGWGSYFNHQKDHFDLSAGYEFQYYFHQNIFFKMTTAESYGTALDDLMLQGLTVKAQFDF